MKIACPACGQSLGIVHTDPHTGLARCPVCFSQYDPEAIDEAMLYPPAGSKLDIFETVEGDIVILQPPRRRWGRFFNRGLMALLLLGAQVSLLLHPALFRFPGTASLFALLFFGLSLWIAYGALNALNETQWLYIKNGELQWHRDRFFRADQRRFLFRELARFSVEDKYFFRDRFLLPRVPTLRTRKGEALHFFEGLTEAEIDWLRNTLQEVIAERGGHLG
jgi:hypothetical protein